MRGRSYRHSRKSSSSRAARHPAGELRIKAPMDGESALLRVFCHATGDRVILLLGGYDKGKDPARRRQDHEIEVARRRLAEHLRRRQGGGWDLSGLEET